MGLIAVIAFVAVVGLGAGVYWSDARHWFGPAVPPRTVTVSGNIEAHESILAFKTVQSRIIDLPFDEGASVKAGTVIARVDGTDYRQQVAIASSVLEVQKRQFEAAEQNWDAARSTLLSDEADLAQKKSDADRALKLWKEGTVSTQARDQAATAAKQSAAMLQRDQALALAAQHSVALAQANIDNAQASLGMADIVLGYTTLVAPFDGVITVRQAELGEIAVPGTPIATLADLDHIWLRAYINETDISRIRLGEGATVTTDTYPGKKYQGRISFISSEAEFTPKSVETHAERVTLVYRIRIDIDNPTHELVPGMPADAVIDALPP
ncbi:MAG TPA: efflux RND transporter periplasmic adaptor subunit [Stellaceae bacterium]|nr:efflux RND transporter periplasmic adaptor subunit [Stellaceae bacterium]